MRLAVYGTLRIGSNAGMRVFTENASIIKEKYILDGYELRMSPYGYPYALRSNSDSIVVDLLDVDHGSFKSINSIEIGAGYTPETISIDKNDYIIYLYERNTSYLPKIRNGDYLERIIDE